MIPMLGKPVGNGFVFRAFSVGNHYEFKLSKKWGGTLWKVDCTRDGKNAKLGKLIDCRDFFKGTRSDFAKSLEIDLLRHHAEEFLYRAGVREVSGRTNPKMVKFMEKRGWKIDSLGQIGKTLSPQNNPEPLLQRRIALANKAKAAKRKPFFARLKSRLRP